MRRKKQFIFILLLLLIMPITTGVITKSSAITVYEDCTHADDINIVTKELGALNITVDPRIELLTAVQQQSGYDMLTQFDFKYKEDMENYFKTYKEYEVVKQFKEMSNCGFVYDAPLEAMLHLSNPSKLIQKVEFSDELTVRAGGKNNLISFVENLRQFSRDTNFNNFYNKHTAFYNTIVNNVSKDIEDQELTEALDSYYGMDVNSYNIILTPMLYTDSYGPGIKGENGLYDLYAIFGPRDVKGESNKESTPIFSSEYIKDTVWHEFSHSFINPTTDEYLDEINKYDKLYSKISKKMESQAYTSWKTCVNEHIVRAVTARLNYTYVGKAAGDQAIAYEKGNGFFYIEALCKSLEVYENNRDTYPSFDSYYPELIKVFKELSEKDLPDSFYQIDFIGPINAAVQNVNGLNIAIIIPTNEEDKKIQEEIYTYVGEYKNHFFPQAEIMKDADALKKDLSNYFIIAYGTINGNLWLDHYKNVFPVQINADNIMADKEYIGTDLSFISALPNPQNYKNPLLVYTAQKSEDILHRILHGPTDYVIAKDIKELHSGNYDKNKDKWTFKE